MRYLPTMSQLIDRLSIVTLKSVKIPEHKADYEQEARDIMSDISSRHPGFVKDNFGQFVRAVQLNMLANELIWANEASARKTGDISNADLVLTHSINGVRCAAMNAISGMFGERVDHKVDCLASEVCSRAGYDFTGILED